MRAWPIPPSSPIMIALVFMLLSLSKVSPFKLERRMHLRSIVHQHHADTLASFSRVAQSNTSPNRRQISTNLPERSNDRALEPLPPASQSPQSQSESNLFGTPNVDETIKTPFNLIGVKGQNTGPLRIFSRIFEAISTTVASVLLIAILFRPAMVHAKPKQRPTDPSYKTSIESNYERKNVKGSQSPPSRRKVDVKVLVKSSDKQKEAASTSTKSGNKIMSLSNIGGALIVLTGIATFVSSDSSSKSKRPKSKIKKVPPSRRNPAINSADNIGGRETERDGDDDEEVLRPRSRKISIERGKLNGLMSRLESTLQDQSRLTSREDISAIENDSFSQDREQVDDSEYVVVSAGEKEKGEKDPKKGSNESLKKDKGILGRLFSKPGGGRETDLGKVLALETKAQVFRTATAKVLAAYVPEDVFPELQEYLKDEKKDENSLETKLDLLEKVKVASDLSSQEAAEAFADVASSVLVAMVDRAADSMTASDKKNDQEQVIEDLDRITNLMKVAGEIFNKVAIGAKIDAVQYNGSLRRGKLEDLYYLYAKKSLNLDDMMKSLGPLLGSKEPEQSNDSLPALSISAEEREQRLLQIQQLFAIKQSKQESIQQRIVREQFMSITKGDGNGFGLNGMMDALAGKGDKSPSISDIGSLMEGLGGAAGKMGLPSDLDNMDPAEAAEMSKAAVDAVKSSLADGSVSKKDVEELEKLMGSSIGDLMKMIGGSEFDKNKLKELGPGFEELVDIFKQLDDIKKRS